MSTCLACIICASIFPDNLANCQLLPRVKPEIEGVGKYSLNEVLGFNKLKWVKSEILH